MAISFVGLLILIVVVGVGAAFVLTVTRMLTQRDVEEHVEVVRRPRREPGLGALTVFLFAGAVLLGLFLLGSWVVVRTDHATEWSPPRPGTMGSWSVARADHATVTRVASSEGGVPSPVTVVTAERDQTIPQVPEKLPHETVPETRVVETEDDSSAAAAVAERGASESDAPANGSGLPAWTQTPEQTLTTGQVPTVRRVIQSGLYASQDEADRVAYQKLQSELRARLAGSYPQLASWTIPQPTLQACCVKQTHVEVRETQFGQYKEPMYQVWLQYEDSPRVREPIVAEWERSAVDGRTFLFASGAGFIALFLGTVSAGVRMMIAPSGRRGRAALATLALGVGTGLAAFSLFVS
ncbi:hypothetical protein GC176_21640 [bacterium]|nr:hypothetical protein [bacterium]